MPVSIHNISVLVFCFVFVFKLSFLSIEVLDVELNLVANDFNSVVVRRKIEEKISELFKRKENISSIFATLRSNKN